MDSTFKNRCYRLIKAHGSGNWEFDDFVAGKGKGLVGLLYGEPGLGKTYTAEAIAETARMPLYSVSSGALGSDVETISTRLTHILDLATHWRAVLLVDEADVFLTKRTIADLERNAIVSVFLREIEYYPGILILTTNRAESIDAAFRSKSRE
jgi:SpoVK/Ycf46/Vps4 family AAA+-type ATPase